MIFGKTRLELTVGFFIFLGLVILLVFVFLIGDFKTWTAGYPVNFTFGFINGVKIGAPVRFAGVDVGEVKKINVEYLSQLQQTQVTITGWVKKNIKIPRDSTVWVNTLGLLGEKYIEVMPGDDYANFISPGGSITGNDPIAMHEVAQLAKDLVDNIDEGITKIKNEEGTVGKLLYDDVLYQELEAFIKDIRKHPWKLFFKAKEKKN
jgi:phospholipid/cholesterol/gamma-HCH transport system substrate-binding protein